MEHYIFRSTLDKLPEHIQHITESGDTVVGDPTFVGGRDWVLLCRKGGPRVADLTPDELELLISKAVAKGLTMGDRLAGQRAKVRR